MGVFQLFDITQECKAEASRSGTFDRGAYEACMIRKGFQQREDGSFTRSTGISREALIGISSIAIPAISVASVEKVATQVGANPGGASTTTTKAIPGPVTGPMPASAGSASTGPAMSSQTLLLLGAAALVLLFAVRR